MRSTKMIRGGRALAAALAGAPVFVKSGDGDYMPTAAGAAERWRRLYNAESLRSNDFAVRADDARRVLG